MRTLRGHASHVIGVAFHPSGTRLASTSGDHTVKIWDTTSGQEILSFQGENREFSYVAFSPNGTRLAAASLDGTVRLWDARPWTAEAPVEDEALGLLEYLFSKPLCKADVIDWITSSATVTPQARQMAMALVERYPEEDNAARYHQAAWAVVRRRYFNPFQYRFALCQAHTARRLAPGQGEFLTTLGAAQYRAGQYLQAKATLAQADLLYRTAAAGLAFLAPQFPQGLATLRNAQSIRQAIPANLAFLAMTHHQLGRKELAQATLAHLREIVETPEWAKDQEVQSLLFEAEMLMVGSGRFKRNEPTRGEANSE